MRYRKLGRSGLVVSEICFGTMTFGGEGVFWRVIGAQEVDEAAFKLVRHAFDKGVTFIVESGEGLRVESGRPVVDDPDENRWLQGAIEKASDPSTRDALDPDRHFEVRRSGIDGQFPVLVTPLLAPASHSTLPDTAAMIFLGNPKLAYVTATHLLRNLYNLTRAEADLTWLLADGLSLEEAAERRGVTLNTARSQLKRVFSKTGVRRQSDLVRIVLSGVGAMRGPG